MNADAIVVFYKMANERLKESEKEQTQFHGPRYQMRLTKLHNFHWILSGKFNEGAFVGTELVFFSQK